MDLLVEKSEKAGYFLSLAPPRLIRGYLVEFEFSMKIYFDSRINLHGYHTKIKLKSTGKDHFEKEYFNVILFCIFFKSGASFDQLRPPPRHFVPPPIRMEELHGSSWVLV